MSNSRRYAIPILVIGMILSMLYVVFSASSKGSNRDPVAKFAVGALAALDTSEQGERAPPAPFTILDGSDTNLQAFEGKLLLVNFWATWCGPCEREMPSLAALQTARGGDRFQIIAISVDSAEDRDYAVRRLGELSGGGLEFYALRPDPSGWDIVYDTGGGGGFPTSILYAADGTKIAKLKGDADWTSYEAIALIDSLLAQ